MLLDFHTVITSSAIQFRDRTTGDTKDAIASLESVVQNKQDCPEDKGHWESFAGAIAIYNQ
jgi:hypothetical protein